MIDLHIHTTYSDGSMTPVEILQEAQSLGIQMLSITDHNSVDAYQDLQKKDIRNVFSGEIITGVEFATVVFGQVVEILGYGFDLMPISKFVESAYGDKADYMRRELHFIYSTYQKIGVHMCKQESEFSVAEYGSAKRFVFDELVREENKKFFLDASNQKRFKGFIRGEIYNPESLLYVDYSKLLPSPSEIIATIHKAGGHAFLAHCFLYTDQIWNHLDDVLETIPLDGIEVWYSTFTDEQTASLEEFCRRNYLLMSGGSDFHGRNRPKISLGNPQINVSKIHEWCKQYFRKSESRMEELLRW